MLKPYLIVLLFHKTTVAYFSPFQVHYRDKLPKTVCQNCADHLVHQYEFIKSVQMKAKLYKDYENKKLSIYDLLNNRETLSRGS